MIILRTVGGPNTRGRAPVPGGGQSTRRPPSPSWTTALAGRSARTGLVVLALTAAATLASCDGPRNGSGLHTHPGLAEGEALFRSSCSACHTLAARPGLRLPGGSLRGYRMTPAQVASFVRIMPLHFPLSPHQVQAVATYVAHIEEHAAHRSAPPPR